MLSAYSYKKYTHHFYFSHNDKFYFSIFRVTMVSHLVKKEIMFLFLFLADLSTKEVKIIYSIFFPLVFSLKLLIYVLLVSTKEY